MRKIACFLLLIVCIYSNVSSQNFSPEQRAWFYRVVKKTSCLKRNWNNFVIYRDDLSERNQVPYYNDEDIQSHDVCLWDSIEQNIIQYPELLEINWDAIRKSSPGLIADAAVKLALWELYSKIKLGYAQSPPFTGDAEIKVLYEEMLEAMPEKTIHNGLIKDKYLPEFYNIINPSLSIKRKFKAIENIGKISAQEKRKVFDR